MYRHTCRSTNVVSMSGQHHRCWPNIETTLAKFQSDWCVPAYFILVNNLSLTRNLDVGLLVYIFLGHKYEAL